MQPGYPACMGEIEFSEHRKKAEVAQMIRACIFDLDGTLADTLQSLAWFGNTALERNGFAPVETEAYKQMVGNGADRLIRRMLTRSVGSFDEETVLRVRKTYDDLYAATPLYRTVSYPGIPELVKALGERGILCAVLSNKPDAMTQLVIQALFPEGSFASVLGQKDAIPKKPAPDGALLTAERLGVLPEECLYIGDTNVDMQTGNAAGMHTIGVLWGFRDRKELEESHAAEIVSEASEILKIADRIGIAGRNAE